MRRIVLHMMVSLDGLVASTDDESWMVPDPERDAASLETANRADSALIGHGVYHDMVGYWPTAEGETETQRSYIRRINPMRKYVVTHEPTALKWNAEALVVTHEDLIERVRELKEGDGSDAGDIVLWGGGQLVHQLAVADLIDEYQLFLQPIALGRGVGLFADAPSWQRMKLLEARSFETGTVYLRYRPVRDEPSTED